jgi:hypothetical protein
MYAAMSVLSPNGEVFRIFLLVNIWNRNRLRTILEEIVFGKELKMNDEVVDQEKLMTAVTGRFYVV